MIKKVLKIENSTAVILLKMFARLYFTLSQLKSVKNYCKNGQICLVIITIIIL